MEGEAVIRAKNLVSLSGFSPREVASLVKEAKELRRIDDDRVIDKLVEAASQTDDSIVNEVTEQAMLHVAGYLARTTMNGSRKIPPTKIPPTKIPPSENSTHVKFHPTID